MFYINVIVWLVKSILVSCLLTFLSSGVTRDYGVVNIGHACSFRMWIYWNTYPLSHLIQYLHTCCHIPVVYTYRPECWCHGVLSRGGCWKTLNKTSDLVWWIIIISISPLWNCMKIQIYYVAIWACCICGQHKMIIAVHDFSHFLENSYSHIMCNLKHIPRKRAWKSPEQKIKLFRSWILQQNGSLKQQLLFLRGQILLISWHHKKGAGL